MTHSMGLPLCNKKNVNNDVSISWQGKLNVQNPNLTKLASALMPAKEMSIVQVPKNVVLMDAGTFA